MAGAVQAVGSVFHGIGQLFSPPKAPTLSTPSALSAQPTVAEASQKAIDKELQDEKQAASTSSIITGGPALLDQAPPTTTSRTLMGS